tara:strand:- start:303 stop:608 length:306 start_codon:yes stop_codon:yes gene_type:complete
MREGLGTGGAVAGGRSRPLDGRRGNPKGLELFVVRDHHLSLDDSGPAGISREFFVQRSAATPRCGESDCGRCVIFAGFREARGIFAPGDAGGLGGRAGFLK